MSNKTIHSNINNKSFSIVILSLSIPDLADYQGIQVLKKLVPEKTQILLINIEFKQLVRIEDIT